MSPADILTAAGVPLPAMPPDTQQPGAVLTDRQRQILSLFAVGLEAAEIGEALFLATATVKQHMKNAYRRLRARNGVHAVMLALELGELHQAPAGGPSLATQMCVDESHARARAKTARQPPPPPVPAEVYERYPSCRWGEDEWLIALKDDDLTARILRGIGRAGRKPRPDTRGG